MLPFRGILQLANRYNEEYANKLGRVPLQLHDRLVLEVEGILSMEDSYMCTIIGTDILGKQSNQIRTAAFMHDRDSCFLNVEASPKYSEVLLPLPLSQ